LTASKLLPPWLISTLVVVGAFAGCGGASGDHAAESRYIVEASTTMAAASPSISKERFVNYINKACRRALGKVTDNWYVYRSTQDPKMGRDARFSDALRESLLPGIDFLIFDEIHILGSPPGAEHVIERIIGAMQLAVETGEHGLWQAHSITEVTPHFDVYNSRARHYGLTDCVADNAHLGRIKP
jgi:hypothetical protein